MLWIISCVSKPNSETLHHKLRPAHREYLKVKEDILVLSGGTKNDDGTKSTGLIFVINVNSRSEAEAFSAAEPYTQGGVFASVNFTHMKKGHWNPKAAEGA